MSKPVRRLGGVSIYLSLLLSILAVVPLVIAAAAQPQPSADDGRAQIDGDGARVFATVHNPTMYDVYLVSVASAAAARAAFRDATGGPEAPVKEIAVPAYGKIELRAGGVHIALGGLKRALQAGDDIALQITTDGGVAIELTATVVK